jgi:uncharacterized protein YoxC
VNTSAIWMLDIIIAVSMTLMTIAAIVLARWIVTFSKSLAATFGDIQRQTGDVESEVIRLMQSTQTSEHHFDELTKRLTKLAASADTVVKVLPSAVLNRNGSVLPRVFGVATSAVTAYKLFRPIFSRRRS